MKVKFLFLCCFAALKSFAQNDTTVVDISNEVDNKKKWASDESSLKVFYGQRLINANTVEVLRKGVMEFKVIHNFGDIGGDNGGIKEFYGLDNAADIKIAFQIGLGNRLNIVAARTRGEQTSVGDNVYRVGPVKELWELGLKYQFLKQEKDSKHPFSLTVYANTVVSTMDSIGGQFQESAFHDFSDRLSEMIQLMIARRFGNISLQLSPTYVHTNYVLPEKDGKDLFALGAGMRLPLSKKFFLIADYFHTFRSQESKDFLSSHNIESRDIFGIGVEILTEGHVFHMNFTNSRNILENRFIPRTYSSWGDGEFRWGFTISRNFILFRDKKANHK
ncbi:MAG TPA: DUF5777 family beta-barrel protein [Chitinophagaceae bacterium]|jgi:hypothetical protein|nr:DUF5777 family beta-barrel protein [Chitinophagaceae bacterium]